MNVECRTRPGPRHPRPARASHSQVRSRGAGLGLGTKGMLPVASPQRFPPPFSPRPARPCVPSPPPPALLGVGVCNGNQMGLEETEGAGLLEGAPPRWAVLQSSRSPSLTGCPEMSDDTRPQKNVAAFSWLCHPIVQAVRPGHHKKRCHE